MHFIKREKIETPGSVQLITLIILRHVLCLLRFVFNTSPSTFRPLRRIPIMKRRTVTWASLLVPQRSWRLVTFDTFEKATFMVCSTIIREIYISKIINFKCCTYMNVLLNLQGVFFTGSATALHTLSARWCHLGNNKLQKLEDALIEQKQAAADRGD